MPFVNFDKEQSFKDILQANKGGIKISEKWKNKIIPFTQDELKSYCQRVIFKTKSITKRKLLRLIYNHKNTFEDFNSISLTGELFTVNNDGVEVKGEIIQKGDGVKGYNGNGPITYHFKEVK